ncbi:MAG: heavy-metal-associated domain-containing protein [Paludibacteraceae bacterium]
MNMTLKYIVVLFLGVTSITCMAQVKNKKTENVKVYGNCEMCKSTIEKAGNQKKEAKVKWNKEAKMATISYDSLKTSKEDVLKRIALAGYDSYLFSAPDDIYSKLPACCKYKRAKKGVSAAEITRKGNE